MDGREGCRDSIRNSDRDDIGGQRWHMKTAMTPTTRRQREGRGRDEGYRQPEMKGKIATDMVTKLGTQPEAGE